MPNPAVLRKIMKLGRQAGDNAAAWRGAAIAAAALVGVLAIGTIGYHLTEHAGFFDAFYFTVITVTTIGYGELQNFSNEGKAFTIVLVFLSLTVFTYGAGVIARFLVGGTILNMIGEKRMNKRLNELRGHFIICGYGGLGRMIAANFREYGTDFVVIDTDESKCEELTLAGDLAVAGDASEDEVLRKAGLERARALIVVTAEDAMNVYITLSARPINHSITIIARSSGDQCDRKLLQAGATRTVSPIERGAMYISQTALRPSVVDFLDVTASPGGEEIQLEEFVVPPDSVMARRTLKTLDIGRRYSIMIVAIKRTHEDGRLEFNPGADHPIEPFDTLVAIGKADSLRRFQSELEVSKKK